MEEMKKSLSDLRPDPRNANMGTDEGAEMIEESIAEFGFRDAGILDRNGVIVGGNKRTEAAQRVGLTDAIVLKHDGKTPIYIQYDDLDLEDPDNPARKLAYVLNRSQQVSLRWNPDVLQEDMAEVDLTSLFSKKELRRLGIDPDAGSGGIDLEDELADLEGDEAAIDAVASKWEVAVGDLWQLGPHVLACGDSTDFQTVDRAFQAASVAQAHLCLTSPPYGVGKDYESGHIDDWRKTIRESFAVTAKFTPLWFVNLGDRKTNNSGWELHTYGEMVAMFETLGANLIGTRVWVKQPAWSAMPYWRNSYKAVDEFEYLGLFATKKIKHHDRLTAEENNEWGYRGVWQIDSVRANDVHGARYPIELPRRALQMLTDENEVVYEPFSGSGTTLLAAHTMHRKCVAVELLPRYAAVTLDLFQRATGEEPQRIKTANA